VTETSTSRWLDDFTCLEKHCLRYVGHGWPEERAPMLGRMRRQEGCGGGARFAVEQQWHEEEARSEILALQLLLLFFFSS
jgi:hypothetical protein